MRPGQSSYGKNVQVPLHGSCSWRWGKIFLSAFQRKKKKSLKKIPGSLLFSSPATRRGTGEEPVRGSQEQQDDALVGNTQGFQAYTAQRRCPGAVFATPQLLKR